jgi:anti-anti-sigma regulatory factor
MLTVETPPATWLTTLLRPGGPLDVGATDRLVRALHTAAASSDVVVVDVQAVGHLPRAVRRALVEAHRTLTAAGGALVLLDPEGRHGLTEEHADVVQRFRIDPPGPPRE